MSLSEFKEIQKELRKLANTLASVAKLRYEKADFPDELRKALGRVPPGTALGQAVDELAERARRVLNEVRATRSQAFGAVVAAYIRGAQSRGVGTRQYDSSWRVGALMIDFKPEQGRARVLFNREEVLPWSNASSAEDLEALEHKAQSMLEEHVIADEHLAGILGAGFARALPGDQRGLGLQGGTVGVLDFLREVRLEMLRRELASGKPGKTLKTAEFPIWALLYNLDRYRALGGNVRDAERIGFQTGTQAEVGKGLGIVLNGLSVEQEYKVFCYAVRTAQLPGPHGESRR